MINKLKDAIFGNSSFDHAVLDTLESLIEGQKRTASIMKGINKMLDFHRIDIKSLEEALVKIDKRLNDLEKNGK